MIMRNLDVNKKKTQKKTQKNTNKQNQLFLHVYNKLNYIT